MEKSITSRREFLAAVGAVGAASILETAAAAPGHAAEPAEKLAINGGEPVRAQPLHNSAFGPQFYDEVEQRAAGEAMSPRCCSSRRRMPSTSAPSMPWA
jgi:hypothetical protein